MVNIEVVEVKAPAGWASALVNGDESSFDCHNDATDEADYRRFLAWLAEHNLVVVDVAREENGDAIEASFTGNLPHSSYSGGDAITYMCHRIAP